MRSITRRVLRAQQGIQGMRTVYQLARYAPARKVGKHGGPMPTNTPTSEKNAPIRRAFLAHHVAGETADGRSHRKMEEARRVCHAGISRDGAR